jgi:hypothetical protein
MTFQMFAGDTKRLHFTITNGASPPVPLDITDAAVSWQASRGTVARFSRTPVLAKAVGAGITVTDAFNGAFTVDLDPADTSALSGSYYHEVQISDAAGDVATAFTGEFRVLRNLIP